MCTRVHVLISVFCVYVAPCLPTDGNLRHNAGGLSLKHPLLPPSSRHHDPPTPPPILSFPLPSLLFPRLFALTKQKESFNLTQAGPRTWLQAVEAFLCYYEETNLAPHLTQ